MIRTIFIILILTSMPSLAFCADIDEWQKLLDEGKIAIKANDPSYAVYKLRQSWRVVPEKESQAYSKIKKTLAIALKANGENLDDSIETLSKRIQQRESNSPTGEFSVELDQDGSLNFYASEGLYAPTAGYCATGSLRSTDAEKAKLSELAKEQTERQKQMHSRMPIIIKPGSGKYRDLVSLCGSIKAGERKQIDFDLNPFLPKEFQTSEDL